MTETLVRDTPQPKRKQRRRGSRFRTLLFVALLVALGLVATGVLPVQQYLERENDVVNAQARLDELREDNAALSDSADAMLTDQEVERIAREQYGFVREGEVGYTVITPDGAAPEGATPVAVEAIPDERSLLERMWDFITGGDETPEG
ncbi:MAG: FtsB family cell division protein [Acidimicrobiia bacterium]